MGKLLIKWGLKSMESASSSSSSGGSASVLDYDNLVFPFVVLAAGVTGGAAALVLEGARAGGRNASSAKNKSKKKKRRRKSLRTAKLKKQKFVFDYSEPFTEGLREGS